MGRPPSDEHCYYCEENHIPAECKRYKAEKSRKEIAKRKKMCHLCFVKSDKYHSPKNKECPTNETCFSWYSTDHHSVFCPTRIEELKKGMFLPKIDEDLLARFVETSEIDEKYLLATSSALAQKIIPIKEIKVVDQIRERHKSLKDYKDSTFVVTLKLWLQQSDMINKFLKEQIICKSGYVHVNVSDIKIAAKRFLQMFSSITKMILFGKLNSEVTFSDIIEKVPNIEVYKTENKCLKVNGETTNTNIRKNINFLKYFIELRKGIFLPKIDDNLLARFVETLEIDEKYLLATSSAMAQKFLPLKKIKVVDKIRKRHESLKDYKDSIFVVTLKLWLHRNDMIKKFLKEQIICKSRYVDLSDIKIPAKQFLQIFSPITKEISLGKLKSEVTFSDIIKRVPNIEIFVMRGISLKANGETWIKDLMKSKKSKNFRQLCISLNTIEFDVELLKEFILTKCINNVIISIFYDTSLSQDTIDIFVDKIGKVFIEEQCPGFGSELDIRINNGRSWRYFTLDIETTALKATRKRKRDSQ